MLTCHEPMRLVHSRMYNHLLCAGLYFVSNCVTAYHSFYPSYQLLLVQVSTHCCHRSSGPCFVQHMTRPHFHVLYATPTSHRGLATTVQYAAACGLKCSRMGLPLASTRAITCSLSTSSSLPTESSTSSQKCDSRVCRQQAARAGRVL